jgi:hypothetical protein
LQQSDSLSQNEKSEKRRSQFEQTVTDNLVRIREQEQSEDSKLFAERRAEDAAIAARIQTLRSRTRTDEEQKAVALFSASLTDALRVRRSKTDDAMLRFRSSLRAVITAREEQSLLAIDSLRTDAHQAIARAEHTCTSADTVDTAREGLRTDLARITHDFGVRRDALAEGDTSLISLRDGREQALQSAGDAYRLAVAEASRALRASVSFSTDLSR